MVKLNGDYKLYIFMRDKVKILIITMTINLLVLWFK
jgi:hypothetical protein